MSGLLGDLHLGPGDPLDFGDLAEVADRAARTERVSAGAGGSAFNTGSGGMSVHAPQPVEMWIMVRENPPPSGSGSSRNHYSWDAVYYDHTINDWVAKEPIEGSNYGDTPAIEIDGNEDVPEFAIVRAWISESGNAILFRYIPSTGNGSVSNLTNVTWNLTNSTVTNLGTTQYNYGPYTTNIYQGSVYYPIYVNGSPNTTTNPSTFFVGGSTHNWVIPPGAGTRIGIAAEDEYHVITSIDPGLNPHGRVICLHNVGDKVILLEHQSASGDASKRILVGNGPQYFWMAPGHEVTLVYDATNTVNRWRVAENSECRLGAYKVYDPFSADRDDWEPIARAHTHYVSCSGGVARRITGMAGGIEGLRRRIVNYDTTDPIILGHEDTGSLATSRFSCPRNVDFWLMPGQVVDAEWSSSFERWFLLSPGPIRAEYDGATGIIYPHTFAFDPAYFDLTEPSDGVALLSITPGTVVASLTDTYIGYGNASDELTGSADLIRTAAGQIRMLGIGNPASECPTLTMLTRRAASADLVANDQAGLLVFQGRANTTDDDLAYLLCRYTGSGTTHTGDLELWGVDSGTPNLGLTVLGDGDVIVENASTVDKLLGTNASDGAVININVGSGLSYDSGTQTLSASGGAASLTATYIGFGDGSNLLSGSSNFTFDGTNVDRKVPSPAAYRMLGFSGANTTLSKFLGGHAGGSGASPTATSDGQPLARFAGIRYDGGWQDESAMIDFVAAATSLADIVFRTGSTTSPTDRLSILNSGEIRCHGLTASQIVGTDADKDLVSISSVSPTLGGTGLTTYTTGDLLYASAANTLAKLAAGIEGKYLRQGASIPAWTFVKGEIVASLSVATDESTTSTSYTDLTTADSVAYTFEANMDVWVDYQSLTYSSIANGNCISQIFLDGSAVSGTEFSHTQVDQAGIGQAHNLRFKISVTAGSRTISVQHKAQATTTANWLGRSLIVMRA